MYDSILRNVLLPTYGHVVRRDGFTGYLREYEANQRLSRDAILDLQLQKLNGLLAHAWRTVPYLSRRWTEAGLSDRPLASLSELQTYPLLGKEDVTTNFSQMISTEWRGKTLSKTTTGSTGVPFRIEYTRESDARRRAVMWRGYAWSGARMGDRCVYLWGMPPSGLTQLQRLKMNLYDRAYNRFMLDSFSMSEDNLQEYAARLLRIRPRYVVAYVNPLVALSRWAVENRVSLAGPEAVLTGAEGLSEFQREIISQAFRAPVSNTYGCREVMLIAAECRFRKLHYNADHLILETVDEGGAVVTESAGRVVLTDLHNYAMPLVRYVNGDAVTHSPETCACGLPLPVLARVDGRVLDMIRTQDGRLVPGEFFMFLLKDLSSIKEFQIVQRSLDSLELKLVPRGSIPQRDLDGLLGGIHAKMGRDVQVVVNIVDNIPRTASGKLRSTVSMLSASH